MVVVNIVTLPNILVDNYNMTVALKAAQSVVVVDIVTLPTIIVNKHRLLVTQISLVTDHGGHMVMDTPNSRIKGGRHHTTAQMLPHHKKEEHTGTHTTIK